MQYFLSPLMGFIPQQFKEIKHWLEIGIEKNERINI